VAEFVFVLALNLLRKACTADSMLRDPSSRQLYCPLIFRKACTVDPMLVKGRFDWRYYLGNELMGKTLGVIGTGNIGKRVIQIAHGFNMNILSTTAHPSPEREKKLEVKFVEIDTLLSECDILTLHLPLTKETEHMIGASQLAKMKPTAVLINTARGKLIDEEALVDAIRGRKIAGAGLDVFENEPLPIDSPLLDLDNVILTPHIAFLTEESIDECTYICIENVETFLSGKPQNVVNPEVLAR
jgi:D-3-phosphoglycerate dehydrogenase